MRRTALLEHDIFFSAADAEMFLADAIRHRLVEAGLECFCPSEEFRTSKSYGDEMPHAIRSCRVAAFLISSQATESQFVFLEAGAAYACGLPISVLLTDLPENKISPFFKDFPKFQLWKEFPKLAASIRRKTQRQAV